MLRSAKAPSCAAAAGITTTYSDLPQLTLFTGRWRLYSWSSASCFETGLFGTAGAQPVAQLTDLEALEGNTKTRSASARAQSNLPSWAAPIKIVTGKF